MNAQYLGIIHLVAYYFTPQDFAPCAGQIITITGNEALYSLIGTFYGGNGVSSFGLPDLRGRVPVGQGQSPYGYFGMGQKAGSEYVSLDHIQEMPLHDHAVTMRPSVAGGTNTTSALYQGLAGDVTGNSIYSDNNPELHYPLNPKTVKQNTVGEGQSHENRQPYLGLNFVICMKGLYPSRS